MDMAKTKTKRTKPDAEKRGRGRPASGLTRRFQVRCTDDDIARWTQIAASRGLNVGTWLRMLALDEERTEIERKIGAAPAGKA